MAEDGLVRGVDPDGRPDHLPDLTPTELRDAAGQVNPDDIGIAHIRTDGPFVRVDTADGGTHVFRPEVGHGMPHVADTTVRAGTTADPHLTRVNDRVAADQLTRVWVHEISETVQAHRAAEPQTPLRRAIDRLSSLLGHGPTVEPDPHTTARLDERRYLVRELTEATNPAEQARLRQDVLGLDRELAGTGYPTHDLARLPEPGTTIQRALLGDDGPSFPVADQPIPEAVPRDPDGVFRDLHAECLDIAAEQRHLADSLRGDGKYWFAKVYHHVTMFELRMIDGGGYTYPIMKLQEVVAFHATYRTNMDAWLGGRFGDVEPNWAAAFDAAESAAGGRHLLPTLKVLEALLPSMQAHIRFDLPRAIADVYERQYAHTGLDLGTFARDFDRMGPVFDQASAALRPEIAAETFPGDPGQYGFAQRYGMRFVFDVPQERLHAWEKAEQIVVAHAEGIHDQAGVQRRVEDYLRTAHPLSGRDFNIGGERVTGYDWDNQPVTASEVPQSQFHGYGREVPDPATVERLARQAVGDAPVDVRVVPADALPDRAVARTVPDGDGYRIEISDRAADANVPRAVAHELAELRAIREREANGLDLSPEDALRAGRFADGATLSPHDRGRLAEVEVLAEQARDPAVRDQALAEARALRDHLGLHPRDPGALARWDLAGSELSPAGRALLDGWPADRPARLADLGPQELTRAMAELRPYFPNDWVRVSADALRITTPDGTTVAMRVVVETGTHDGRAGGEHVIRLDPRLAPENVVRALVDRAADIFAAETGGRPESGVMRQLDVLATERARVQYQLGQDPARRDALAAEHDRLTREFRTQAERLGILGPEGRPDTDPAVRARRDEMWAELSDGARAIVFTMADPAAAAAAGSSAKARSFLPMTDEFRAPYNAIDSFTYFVEVHTSVEIRQRFAAELMPQIREFQATALERFKADYREFFPSTSAERPLPPDAAAAAADRVAPLVEGTERMLADIRDWADSTGVPELRRDAFDEAVELGEHAWRVRYEQFKAMVDELIAGFDYLGQPLGYIGSMQDGMRGPHKAMAHADLRGFDIDLYVIHPDDFDARYDAVREHLPNQVSRGKIFPIPDATYTPELFRLGERIAEALSELFPGNTDVLDSMIVLRREPPY